MSILNTVEGKKSAANLRIGIVAARWNSAITEQLISGAVEKILECGGKKENIQLVRVPGCHEIPIVCKHLASKKDIDGIVALGALIRGETDHYNYVAHGTITGITLVSNETGMPIGFGVVTAQNIEQAISRSQPGIDNKGSEAASAVIETASVIRELKNIE